MTLRLPGRDPSLPIVFRHAESPTHYLIAFRVPTPASNTVAELVCDGRVLARIQLTIISRAEFLKSLQLESSIVHVRLDHESVACQAIVANQCHGLIASGKLSAASNLAPLSDLGLTVEFRGDTGESRVLVNVPLSAAQLQATEAVVVAAPRKLSRKARGWTITWLVGNQVLALSRVRMIRLPELRKSLHLVGAGLSWTTARRRRYAGKRLHRAKPCALARASS